MTLLETIERARKHWQNLPPHVQARDTAKRLRDLLTIVDALIREDKLRREGNIDDACKNTLSPEQPQPISKHD